MNLKKIILATTLSLLTANLNASPIQSSIQSLAKNKTTHYSKTIPYTPQNPEDQKPSNYKQKAIFRPEDMETELIEINPNEYNYNNHKSNNFKIPPKRVKQPSSLSNSF